MDLEVEIRTLVEKGQVTEAATCAIEGYGPEVLGFLVNLLGHPIDADDAFAQTCEDLWAGLAKFEWRSSARTWIYVLARNASSRLLRSPHRRAGRQLPLSQISEAAERVRSRTAPHLRTEVKDAFAAIRDGLEPDDRALLVLRVDREMGWNDIARVLYPEEAEKSDADLARLAARLRKRFQHVKEEVRDKAKAAGLFGDEA